MLRKALKLGSKLNRYGLWLQVGLVVAGYVVKKLDEKKRRKDEHDLGTAPDLP